MGLDRFERRYLGLGGGEGGGLEAGCDGDGVFAVTVVDWIDMSVARSTGSTCQLHGHTAGLTVYGHGGLFAVDACDPADDLEEPGGVVVDRDEGVVGGHEEAGVPQVRHVAFRDRGGGEGVREEGRVGGEGERRMGGGSVDMGGVGLRVGRLRLFMFARRVPGGFPKLQFTTTTRRCLFCTSPMAPLQFQPLASQPTPAFWAALAAHKLNHLKLDDSHLPITAQIEPAKRVLINKERVDDTADVGIDGSLVVGGDAFEAERGR